MWHERLEGHLWITLRAYHLVHLLRDRLKEQGIHTLNSLGDLKSVIGCYEDGSGLR